MAHTTRIMYIENKGGDEHTHWWGTTHIPQRTSRALGASVE